MKLEIGIVLFALLALLFTQGYELTYRYQHEDEEMKEEMKEAFQAAIRQELSGRMHNSKPKDPNNPKFIIRRARDMTPEERANLKGDTIQLSEAREKGLGESLVDLLQHRMQDGLLADHREPRIKMLDSLFALQMAKRELRVKTGVALLDSSRNVISSAGSLTADNRGISTSIIEPIGTQGLRYVQAYAKLSPFRPFTYMLFALILSGVIVVIACGAFFYLLYKIEKARHELTERERAAHSAIHDLKSPLNTTYAAIDLITLSEKDPARLRLLDEGKKRLRGLASTIESMLNLLKQPERKTHLAYATIDPAALAQRVYDEVASLHPEKQPLFKLEKMAGTPSQVETDPVRLERCLRNLIENALSYSDTNVHITIRIEADRKGWRLSIIDTGWGIPRKAIRRLGQQFFRVNPQGKPHVSGYGLGLSSVNLLMKELGGQMQVESQENKGSTFTLSFPITTHRISA